MLARVNEKLMESEAREFSRARIERVALGIVKFVSQRELLECS